MEQVDRDLLIQIAADTKANKDSLKILFHAIEGNGQPGLKQRMTAVETSHTECKKQRETEAAQEPVRNSNAIQVVNILVILALGIITIITTVV